MSDVLPGDPIERIVQKTDAALAAMTTALKAVQGHARRQQPCRAPMDRRLLLAGPGVVLLALLIGIAIGWGFHNPPSQLVCGDQADGSRMCWMYTKLPTVKR